MNPSIWAWTFLCWYSLFYYYFHLFIYYIGLSRFSVSSKYFVFSLSPPDIPLHIKYIGVLYGISHYSEAVSIFPHFFFFFILCKLYLYTLSSLISLQPQNFHLVLCFYFCLFINFLYLLWHCPLIFTSLIMLSFSSVNNLWWLLWSFLLSLSPISYLLFHTTSVT